MPPRRVKKKWLSLIFLRFSVSLRQENKLQPGEVLIKIIVPNRSPRLKSTYPEFTEIGSLDFAIVFVVAAAEGQSRTLIRPHYVLGGVVPIPWRLTNFGQLIEGKRIEEKMG